MSSLANLGFLTLEYREAGSVIAAVLECGGSADASVATPTVVAGVPEEEVARRIAAAREEAVAEAAGRAQAELARDREAREAQLRQTLEAFGEERASYFNRVESEVVHLALSLARKILQREAELDPTIVAALVRIALERMQSGPSVRVRVVPGEVEQWKEWGTRPGSESRWEVVGDEALRPGDCVVETELGEANFGFEAQLRDVEETIAQLLARRPGRV